jgi:primosomal replication protein N
MLELLVCKAEAVGRGMITQTTYQCVVFKGFIAEHKQQSTAVDLDLQKWRFTKQRTWGT